MAGWSLARLALVEVFTKKIQKMNLKQNKFLKISAFSYFSMFSKSNQNIWRSQPVVDRRILIS